MNECKQLSGKECDITIFIPCYDEEKNIVNTLNALLKALRQIGCTYDIVIVDDASRDSTVEVARNFMREHPQEPITLVAQHVNQGFGTNFAEAAFIGKGKFYRAVCGDDCETVETTVKILGYMGQADMILPYLAESGERPLSRRFISQLYTKLINALSGHRLHYYNGLAIHLRLNVMRWHSNAHGFGFQADLVTRLLDMGATYIEVPVSAKERPQGTTKAFSFRNCCSVSNTLLQLCIRRISRILYPHFQRNLHQGQTLYRSNIDDSR